MARRKHKIEILPCAMPAAEGKFDSVADCLVHLEGLPAACGGNKVEMMTDGVTAYHKLMKLIYGAEQSINICVFIFANDEVAASVLRALTEKAAQGVKVRLLIDAVGSFAMRETMFKDLRAAGGEVAWFMTVLPTSRRWSANLRNHRKIFIFDERIAVVGGKNIGKEYMGPDPDPKRWVDFSMTIEGPAVYTIAQVFAADWEFAAGPPAAPVLTKLKAEDFPPQGDVSLQTVASGPDIPGDPLYESLLTAMFQAKERIWIITPYLVPDETILNTLCVLSKMGRDVQIIVPQKTDLRLVDFARRYLLRELHRSGAKIWYYQPSMMHAKVMIVDNQTAFIGSANLDHRSLYLNYEITVCIYSETEIARLAKFFEQLKDKCIHYSRREATRLRGPLEDMAENASRLLSPLL